MDQSSEYKIGKKFVNMDDLVVSLRDVGVQAGVCYEESAQGASILAYLSGNKVLWGYMPTPEVSEYDRNKISAEAILAYRGFELEEIEYLTMSEYSKKGIRGLLLLKRKTEEELRKILNERVVERADLDLLGSETLKKLISANPEIEE